MAVGIPDVTIVFKLGERQRTLVYRKVPVAAWRQLKALQGHTPLKLFSAVVDADIDAIYALIWLERCQRERELNFPTVLQELDKSNDEFEIIYAEARGTPIIDNREDSGVSAAATEVEEDPTAGS